MNPLPPVEHWVEVRPPVADLPRDLLPGDPTSAAERHSEGTATSLHSRARVRYEPPLDAPVESSSGAEKHRSDPDASFDSTGASAIILQPKCSVRDGLRWDALGNRPLIFAANGYSSCDCL